MSYLGFTKVVSSFAEILKSQNKGTVTILEIGVDRGQTTIPLLHNLVANEVDFVYVGVDIRSDPTVVEQFMQMDGIRPHYQGSEHENPNCYYIIQNSLDWLPQFTEKNPDFKFDIILLDGDHNYQTVTKELSYFNQLTLPHSLCVLDDYYGKYAHKDDYYADKPSHDGLDHKNFDRTHEKKGMQQAVQDFLNQEPGWHFYGNEIHMGPGWEPAIITRDLTLSLVEGRAIGFGSRTPNERDNDGK
jgi:hypothetical protein